MRAYFSEQDENKKNTVNGNSAPVSMVSDRVDAVESDSDSDVIASDEVTKQIPRAHEMVDCLLAHLVMNALLPPTIFAIIGMYWPDLVRVIVQTFEKGPLGENALAKLPAMNALISVTVTALEFGVRTFGNKMNNKEGEPNRLVSALPRFGKEDRLVHTPIPQIAPFNRRQAVLFIAIAYVMQTLNGLMMIDPEKLNSESFASTLKTLYDNPLVAFMGQIVATRILDSLLFKAAPAVVSGVNRAGLWVVEKCGDKKPAGYRALSIDPNDPYDLFQDDMFNDASGASAAAAI